MASFTNIPEMSRALAAGRKILDTGKPLDAGKPQVYHVAYDLNTPGQRYDKLIAEINRTENIHILQSSWVIATNEAPSALLARLTAAADGNDRFFISQVTANAYIGTIGQDISDWLAARVS